MTQTATFAYWKRNPAIESNAIGGWCRADDVPSYGIIGHLPLPTDITTTVDEQGNLTAISPPVIGTRTAYRYHLHMRAELRANPASINAEWPESHLTVYTHEAPHKDTDLTNWWWSAHDDFRYPFYTKNTPTTPVRLIKTWKAGMLAILLDGHPDKDKVLARLQGRIQDHNAYVKRRNGARKPNHRKAHDDLVVMPHALTFSSGCVKQIFRYHVESSYGRRNTHSLRIHSTRYTIRHGEAMTFRDGTAPAPQPLLPPIRAAMAYLAWLGAPARTHHDLLKAKAHYSPLLSSAVADTEAWLDANAGAPETVLLNARAAVSALHDFGRAVAPREAIPAAVAEFHAHSRRQADLLDMLHAAIQQHKHVEENAEAEA